MTLMLASAEAQVPLALPPLVTVAGKVGLAAAALTALELALCNRPGLVDTGEHLLAVADKP